MRAGGNGDFRGQNESGELTLPLDTTYLVILSGVLCREGPMQFASRERVHRSFALLRMTGSLLGLMFAIHETAGGVTFVVKVHPRAKKNAITGELGDAIKVSLTTPPVEGRANEACIEFFAKLLKVPRSSVTITSGQASRNKVIRVAGISAAELRARIAM